MLTWASRTPTGATGVAHQVPWWPHPQTPYPSAVASSCRLPPIVAKLGGPSSRCSSHRSWPRSEHAAATGIAHVQRRSLLKTGHLSIRPETKCHHLHLTAVCVIHHGTGYRHVGLGHHHGDLASCVAPSLAACYTGIASEDASILYRGNDRSPIFGGKLHRKCQKYAPKVQKVCTSKVQNQNKIFTPRVDTFDRHSNILNQPIGARFFLVYFFFPFRSDFYDRNNPCKELNLIS